jgi:hypothetical protein
MRPMLIRWPSDPRCRSGPPLATLAPKGGEMRDKPEIGGMGGSIADWERGLDPWHRDAFPDEFKGRAPHRGKRKEGWVALDWCGNIVGFVPDD